jgi:hypothetical protein
MVDLLGPSLYPTNARQLLPQPLHGFGSHRGNTEVCHLHFGIFGNSHELHPAAEPFEQRFADRGVDPDPISFICSSGTAF